VDFGLDGPPAAGTPDLDAGLEARLHRRCVELPALLVMGVVKERIQLRPSGW
jgi:hypothetical protein